MTITEVPPTTVINFDLDQTASFCAAVKAVALGASTDDARAVLTNILVVIEDSTMKLVTTNSYVLFIATLISDPKFAPQGEFMLNAKQLVAALPKGRRNAMSLEIGERSITITPLEGGATTLRIQEGTFPNYKNLIGTERAKVAEPIAFSYEWLSAIARAGQAFGGNGNGAQYPMHFLAGETPLKPAYWDQTVVDRGHFFALVMPVRIP